METDELFLSMLLTYAVPEYLQTCWGMRTWQYICSASGDHKPIEMPHGEEEPKIPVETWGAGLWYSSQNKG